jgi:hypothetical protein
MDQPHDFAAYNMRKRSMMLSRDNTRTGIEPAIDLHGRKLYGDFVHQDFFPFRWIAGAIAISLLYFVVPTWVTIITVVTFSALLIHNLAVMKPRDYVHPLFWPSELLAAAKSKRTRT